MRQEFKDIIAGWTLHDDLDDITDRLEQIDALARATGGLEDDEVRYFVVLINAGLARAQRLAGDLESELLRGLS